MLRKLSLSVLALAVACASDAGQSGQLDGVTWFEGARLIAGDGSTIENSAFLVEDNTFTWVGEQGGMDPPAGAVHVDLSGRTVIPALIDGHQHIGLTNVKDGTDAKANYTREMLVEHLERSAYHGVGATCLLYTSPSPRDS